jgi:chaperonin GroEL
LEKLEPFQKKKLSDTSPHTISLLEITLKANKFMFRRCSKRLLAASSIEAATRGKTIQFGGDARELMLHGIERIAKAVGVTLGPKGRNVIIRQPNGEPKITKDGVTVARSIEFENQFEDVGAKLIRQVAGKTNDVAGDGTTTATILAWSMFAEGYKSVATGANPMDLKRGIDVAVEEILKSLQLQKRPVENIAMLTNVATISANGDRPLGVLIASAVESVGSSGYIHVVDGSAGKTAWVKYDGWSTEHGFVRSALVTDTQELNSTLLDCVVFVTEDAFTSIEDAITLLEAAKAQGKPLVIVAPQVSENVLQLLIANHTQSIVRSGVLSYESAAFGGDVQDVAAACGCSVEKVESISRVNDVGCLLGAATKFAQTMDSTVISGAADVSAYVRHLQGKLERTMTEEEKEVFHERISKLHRTFAVIRVGGRTAVEISESKDRVIDALNAARNALADGIVAGGGSALLHATKRLDYILEQDEEMPQDRRTGILIVRNAARLPMKLIANNAGVEGPVVVENVAEAESTALGYDAQNDAYVDMFEAGIIDPVKVVTSCVMDAASVAGLMITTEASVCDHTDVDLLPRN